MSEICNTSETRDNREGSNSLGEEDGDKFLEHLHSIINGGEYDSSSSEDLQNEAGHFEGADDDEQMQEVFDVLHTGNEKGLRKNKTFSSDQLRDIDRSNSILMKKIISNNRRPSQYAPSSGAKQFQTSAAINRRRQQKKIDQENMVLLKKIQAIKPFGLSKPKHL